MKPETKKRLEDFVERAEEIRTYSYFDGGKNIVGFEVGVGEGGKELQADFYQPNNEQRAAIVLNLRLFFQDKDGISIRKMADLCNDPDISIEWKKEFSFYRNSLNLFYDEIVVEGDKGKLTNKNILDMFLYGKIAHNVNDDTRKSFQQWVTNDIEYEILHNMFHTILVKVLTIILNISSACKEELQQPKI